MEQYQKYDTEFCNLQSEGVKGPAVPQDLDLYGDFCRRFQMGTSPCEHYQLFSAGWKEGVAQAEQVYAQMDLDLVEEIGRAAGFTSRCPPRNDHYRLCRA
jgi:hypothetical protein